MGIKLRALQQMVGRTLALHGPFTRLGHALLHIGTAFAFSRSQQLLRRQRRHFHMQIDAVQQRPADASLIARHLIGRAATGPHARTPVATGAGIHGRNQLKARRKFRALRRPDDGDTPRLQRLAQGLQRTAGKLGQLI